MTQKSKIKVTGRSVSPREWTAIDAAHMAVHATATEFASAEDCALELATRPVRGVPLTSEDRKARRRLQYKLHQRRHRTKQNDVMTGHEQAIAQLRRRIALLEKKRRQALSRRIPATVFDARGTNTGAPARIVMEYLRLFAYGYGGSSPCTTQEQFLRSVMRLNVAGPDYDGIDALLDQWRRYPVFFPHTHLSFEGFQVATAGELTLVVVDTVVALRGRRPGIIALYPGLDGDEFVVQTMVTTGVRIPGKFRFVFGADSVCTWFGSELDFVVGLQKALGSLRAVAKCLQGANMSCATGQITVVHDADHQHRDNRSVCPRGDNSAADEAQWTDTVSWVEL